MLLLDGLRRDPSTTKASIGVGNPQATFLYVFDASGSTAASGGACGTVLQCEQTFFTGLNTAATNGGSVAHIGLVVFGSDAVKADMSPGAGDDQLGLPADGNTVVNSISNGFRIAQYTTKNGSGASTNFAAALQQVLSELNASADAKKFVVFASDGVSNDATITDFNNAVAAIGATGAVVNSIAVGASSSCTTTARRSSSSRLQVPRRIRSPGRERSIGRSRSRETRR